MKRFCHSKEIEILFLLFCSAETQKDLVIRIDSLLLRVHIENFFLSSFLLFCYVLVGIKIKVMHVLAQLPHTTFYFEILFWRNFFILRCRQNNSNRITISASLTIAFGGFFFTKRIKRTEMGVTKYICRRCGVVLSCCLFSTSNAGVKNVVQNFPRSWHKRKWHVMFSALIFVLVLPGVALHIHSRFYSIIIIGNFF
jgi:hypothetical protein